MMVILDRDGVINEDSEDYIKSPEEWQPIPGSLAAIAKLTQAGAIILVTTNQSGIARGLFTLATLEAIHQKMLRAIEQAGGKITKIYFCPHHPEAHCHCRKPEPGMFEAIVKDFKVELSQAIYIGDHWKDMEVGRRMSCQVMLVKTGKGARTIAEHSTEIEALHIPIYDNLLAAVEQGILLESTRNHE